MLKQSPKYKSLKDALPLRAQLKSSRQSVVLTNGCFDLLHVGHIQFLMDAAKQGDALFVALNSDISVRQLKGPSRPILSTAERAFALSALTCTHTVFSFDTERLTNEILELKPDIYVKAGDYDLGTLNKDELEALQSIGAEIRFLPFLKGFSTTQLIQKIQAATQNS